MKTPQEEAEVILNQIVQRFDSECMGKLPDYRAEHYQILKQAIPLSELIAVARAAASDKKDEECTCGTDPERSCRYCGYFIRLDKALQALRATGKVEL